MWRRTSSPSIATAIRDTVKQHLRYTGTQEDSLIDLYVDAAIDRIQEETNLQLLTATFEAKFDAFPIRPNCKLLLHGFPLQSVQSITFEDAETYVETWDSTEYEVKTNAVPGFVRPKVGYTWPIAIRNVTVNYTAGYGASWSSLPKKVQHAVLLLTEHYFDQRAAVNVGNIVTEIPHGLQVILDSLNVGDEFHWVA